MIADDIQVSLEALKLDQNEMDGMTLDERREYMQNAAIKYIGNRVAKNMPKDYRIKRAKDVINRYLLPHMGTEEDKKENLTIRTTILTKDSECLVT